MKNVFYKNIFFIKYIIFGVFSTILNILCYGLLYNYFGISNIISNIVAWIVAAIFAFFTNKILVFKSCNFKLKLFLVEAFKFFGCRLATLVIDLIIMYIGVDLLNGPAILLKVFANIIVIILNYIASKTIIFKV